MGLSYYFESQQISKALKILKIMKEAFKHYFSKIKHLFKKFFKPFMKLHE